MKGKTSEKKFLIKEDSPYDLDLKELKGTYVIDENGKKYIDLMSGWCVGNLGWEREEIARAVNNYKGPDYAYPGFSFRPWNQLAEMLADLAPGNLQYSYRTTGGSESVDTALQVAMAFTGRKKFCSIEDSYHGNTISAISIGAKESVDKLPNHLSNCVRIKAPLDSSALKRLETKLKNRDVAAFILEPVMCNIAVGIPEKDFMSAVKDLCHHYGTLVIADEVACGFGRTGKFFASEHFGLEPDILTMAKAISGGYGPMGATIVTPQIEKKVKSKVSVYSTYGWHPRSTIAAIATIGFLKRNAEKIFSNVDQRSQQFRTGLSQMAFKKKGKLSLIGLAISVDVQDKKYAEKIMNKCFERGLLISAQENNLVMFPPLTIDQKTVETALKIMESAV